MKWLMLHELSVDGRLTVSRLGRDRTTVRAVLAGSAMEPTAILQLRVLTTVTAMPMPSVCRPRQARLSASVSARHVTLSSWNMFVIV